MGREWEGNGKGMVRKGNGRVNGNGMWGCGVEE
jgi:hypothetical protein